MADEAQTETLLERLRVMAADRDNRDNLRVVVAKLHARAAAPGRPTYLLWLPVADTLCAARRRAWMTRVALPGGHL